MQEIKLELEFDTDLYEGYLQGTISLEKFLKETFSPKTNIRHELSNSNDSEIRSTLRELNASEKGSQEVHTFVISNEKFCKKSMEGFLTFEYPLNIYRGCSNLDDQDDKHETARFKIDETNEMITLYFQVYEERTTYEEF